MDIQESVNEKESTSVGEGQPNPAGALSRTPLDRLELQHQWVQQAEEEQVEATLNRYAQAARAHLLGGAPTSPHIDEETPEELEARSQRLKLQQKCQDIAALIMVDEMEEEDLD